MDHSRFYHDLQCLSGYGDRLLDLWAAATITYLHNPENVLDVCWSEGLHYRGFVGNYSTELFSLRNCRFLYEPPGDAIAVEKYFDDSDVNPFGIISLTSDIQQIVLRHGMNWGNNCPDRLLQDLEFYQLNQAIGLQPLIATYREIAATTEPAPSVVEGIPADITNRTAIHIRLTDKLVDNETSIDMNEQTWRAIEFKARFYIELCIDRSEPLLICSDDAAYKTALIEHIRDKGGDVVATCPSPRYQHLNGYEALVDFFALSRCSKIIQMTKYSTFSLAAALAGNVTLVNLYREQGGQNDSSHRLDLWKNTLGDLLVT